MFFLIIIDYDFIYIYHILHVLYNMYHLMYDDGCKTIYGISYAN